MKLCSFINKKMYGFGQFFYRKMPFETLYFGESGGVNELFID